VRENELMYYPFNEKTTKSIEESLAVAATDASVKEGQMKESWIITDVEKKSILKNQLYHKECSDNTLGIAEVIVLLELITILEQKGHHIRSGKIKIGFDNRKQYRKIKNDIKKSNVYA